MQFEIHNAITKLNHHNTHENFCWIPSYVGILGNEHVNFAAKDACSQSSFTTRVTTF